MVQYNPDFPSVLGNQFLATTDQKNRVFAGAPARMLRLPSTTAETIGALKLSACVDPLVRSSIPTLIDVIPEGSEITALPNLAQLVPNSDNVNTGWTTDAGSSSNLFQSIDEATDQWPGPASVGHIRAQAPALEYACGVDASLFNGGAAANGRIFWVAVQAILAANTGFRKLSVKLLIDGVLYDPAGGATRDVHGYGAMQSFWWGEINPATGRPWTPSDIAQFDIQSDWGIRVRSDGAATTSHYPEVMALSLNVSYLNTENRVAVGVWNRPTDIGTSRLLNITTDTLRSMPSGAANWSKPGTGNFLYYWRQTVSPSQYGPAVADDVRWNGLYQDLGPDGQPAGIVYPLQSTGVSPPPAASIASQTIAHDQYGRPQDAFVGTSRAAYGLVLQTTAPADSVDSQPYRLDLADLVAFRSTTGITGQRFVPASTQTFAGFRLPIIPPTTGTSTLTVSLFATGGAQVGTSFTTTADVVRKIGANTSGVRYLTGNFPTTGALTGAVQYEIRLSVTGSDDWIVFAPDCSLGAGTGFGGATSGAIINGTHTTTRDMSVTLIQAPNPPTGLTAALTSIATSTYVASQGLPNVRHVNVTWTIPGAGLGSAFYRYELERQEDSGEWRRVAHFYTSSTAAWVDREAPRQTTVGYRIRAVGKDGRVSTWATSGTVNPPLSASSTNGLAVILTSNHNTGLEVVYFREQESSWLVLSSQNDEMVPIDGSDLQVVFMERNTRGVGWAVNIWVNQVALAGKGGQHVLTPLLNLIRPSADGTLPVPYVCVMDDQGTKIMGHVSIEDVPQMRPQHRYTAQLTVTPTNSVPVPVEVP